MYRHHIAYFPFHPQTSLDTVLSYLDADSEYAVLHNSLIAANKRVNVVISHATRTLMIRHLSDGCQILHLSGHATKDQIVCLEDDTIPGKLNACSKDELAYLFLNAVGNKCPQIVILAMCHSLAFADIFFSAGVQVVIGIAAAHELRDRDGIVFMNQFYYSLLHGATIDDAFYAAKAQMHLSTAELFQMRKQNKAYNAILFPINSLSDGQYVKYELQQPHNIPHVPTSQISQEHVQSARSHIIKHLMKRSRLEVITITGPTRCGKTMVANAAALYLSTRHREGRPIYDALLYIDLSQCKKRHKTITTLVDEILISKRLPAITSTCNYLLIMDGAEHTYSHAPMHYAHTLHAYISDLLVPDGQCQVIVTSLRALRQVENLDNHIHEHELVMATSASTTVVNSSIPVYQQWKLPQQDNITFIDRRTLLHDIHKKLMLSYKRPGVVTAGIGGVGKTQLALRYAHHPPNDYHYHMTAWFYAESVDNLKSQYVEFARQVTNAEEIKADDAIQIVKTWFESHHQWLIVYDNVTEPRDILPFLPRTHNDHETHHTAGYILITSRYQHWNVRFQCIQVGVMDTAQSLALVKASLGDQVADDSVCIELCVLLGHLPLAISYACAFIRYNITYTVTRYIEIYKSKAARNLLEYKDMDAEHVSVYNTWDMTMDKIRTDNVMAVLLLGICGCLSPDGITKSFLVKCRDHIAGGSAGDDATIDTAITLLHQYSLIHYDIISHTLSIHRVLQSVIRQKLDAQLKSLLSRVMSVMNREYLMDRASVLEEEAHRQQLFPHLQSLSTHFNELRLVDDKNDNDIIAWANTLSHLSHAYKRLGDTKKSMELQERVLLIQEHHYGSDDVRLATTLSNIGVGYSELGNSVKAKELHERSLLLQERHYGVDHVNVGTTLSNLAASYRALDNFTKSKELLERALSITECHYGSDHIKLAVTLSNLGLIYNEMGNALKAKEFHERALLIAERHYGSDHVALAVTLSNLAIVHNKLGDGSKAKELYERALLIKERHYGRDHVELVITLINLGVTYNHSGNSVKAKELYERALVIEEREYGIDHVLFGTTLSHLAVAYSDLGDHTKSKELLDRALLILERHYGNDHVQVAMALRSRGMTYSELGDIPKAKESFERALAIFNRHNHHMYAESVKDDLTRLKTQSN